MSGRPFGPWSLVSSAADAQSNRRCNSPSSGCWRRAVAGWRCAALVVVGRTTACGGSKQLAERQGECARRKEVRNSGQVTDDIGRQV
jgi:hypothetical protein